MAKRETKVEGVKELPELEGGFKKVKDLFKAGAVPREADYVMLIEYVHYLHKLLGVEGEDGSSGPGLGVGFIKAEGSALDVDVDALAGAGLTGANGVFNVGAGNGIIVDDNTISLATDSWKYMFAKLYQATHWAGDNAVSVFFTKMSPTHVVVRGIATGSYVFGPYMSDFTWQGVAPLIEYSSLDRSYFTFVYLKGDTISGVFDVWLTRVGIIHEWKYTISEL